MATVEKEQIIFLGWNSFQEAGNQKDKKVGGEVLWTSKLDEQNSKVVEAVARNWGARLRVPLWLRSVRRYVVFAVSSHGTQKRQ